MVADGSKLKFFYFYCLQRHLANTEQGHKLKKLKNNKVQDVTVLSAFCL